MSSRRSSSYPRNTKALSRKEKILLERAMALSQSRIYFSASGSNPSNRSMDDFARLVCFPCSVRVVSRIAKVLLREGHGPLSEQNLPPGEDGRPDE
jgi:hypothetical protein